MAIKVAVICGGSSVEHEVSVITALQAAQALDKSKYRPVALYITKDLRFFTGGDLLDIKAYKDIPSALAGARQVVPVRLEGRPVLMDFPPKALGRPHYEEIDAALLGAHGTNVEDGTLQGLLEYWGVPYTGCSVCASAVGMDKWVMKQVFKSAGLPCLSGVLISKSDYLKDPEGEIKGLLEKIALPMVVKPSNLGSSVGISKARDEEQLKEALDLAFSFAPFALCERAVRNLREINCAVLGDRDGAVASVCEEPLNATDILTYADKYKSGGGKSGSKGGAKSGGQGSGMASLTRKVPAELPQEVSEKIQEMALAAFKAIDASGVARIDFMMDSETGEIFVNEINTIPGSLSYYLWEAGGVSFPQLVDRLISLALKKKRDKDSLTFSFDTNLLEGASLGGSKGSKS